LSEPRLTDLFPEPAKDLLDVKGIDLVQRLGMDAVREVVTGVLTGINLRNATETLTRRRIALINAGLVACYIRGAATRPDFVESLPKRARAELSLKGLSLAEKRVLWWALGLTQKQIQNVLRSDDAAWEQYLTTFEHDLHEVAETAESTYGTLSGLVELGEGEESEGIVDWLWVLYLLTAVGAQTLATRGSEKSMYGKFFEKLILGGVLHVLGFQLVEEDEVTSENVFWLSSRGRKRESDATVLFSKGIGIRFDIGFIGTGNTEISLDKVSRFEREIELGGESHFMHTFIIVDRIGTRSRIAEMAKAIDGTILQMSSSYWPRDLAVAIEDVIEGFESPLAGASDPEVHKMIEEAVATAPFETILRIAAEEGDDTGIELSGEEESIEEEDALGE
jgi:hypothetical protein